ncbi:hydroxymethylglutaryl-CoA lyase [Roseivirga misakiensis]|uniref:Hydroxymethylglutaryl-CoA lyase n=1 Tax=Roseivirga misakiensis TaxID=1563681 RepID=A0A1E5T0E1_9BACT|nr:hydroxymethylglutaryl-CoA lyase [Roseivirga misakiensis]OEK04848.1 hydroxymethylglutaryl-CoA lyase [Roseivirga misakiensis]
MKIIECPRDAMQGLHQFIPTDKKASYINQLLKVGFDTIDFGSFVSPKAIPQLRDTSEVLDQLDLSETKTKLLAIVANLRGAEDAAKFDQIDYLGFPLSISEQFQKRNTNKSIAEALNTLSDIQDVCIRTNKTLVTYISMGFGNPYGEPFNEEIVAEFVDKQKSINASIISLSDTIGVAKPDAIERVFKHSIAAHPEIEFGAHFHSVPDKTNEKLKAALDAGCARFDSAIKGFGGCPMADDDLTGNIATEKLLAYLTEENRNSGLDMEAFQKAMIMSLDVFPVN